MSILRQFIVFLTSSKISFKSIDEEVLCAYIEVIADRVKSPDTVRNYVSALHGLYTRMGFCANIFAHHSVKQALCGIDKSVRHVPTPAFAVTPVLLNQILYLFSGLSQAPTIKCVLTMMYVSMLRQSNFLAASQKAFDSTRQLTRGDVTVQPNGLRLRIKWEKNMQKSTGAAYVLLPYLNDINLCPVRAYFTMLAHIPTVSLDNPLAMFRDYRPIPLYFLQKLWRRAILRLGMDPKHLRLHGLRRGAATYIASCSPQARQRLKEYGRWKSSAYLQYIDDPSACPVYEAFSNI